mgnify:CR=1 FL=1
MYAAVVARSGQTSDCNTFASLFAPNGVYESPVGSTPAVGPAAIYQACQNWNKLLGPQGNGWVTHHLCLSLVDSPFGSVPR